MASLSLPPLSAYYCYDPVDIDFCKALDVYLDPLKRRGWIQTWDDQQIPPGAERERERDTHLRTADLLFLLISADFLASESGIHTIEMALQRHRDGEAVAIPILVRAANWEETDLQILQVLPREQTAIATWPDQDTIWHEVARELQRVVETMRQWVFVVSSPEDQEFVERLRQDMAPAHVLLWSQEKGPDEAQRDAMRAASAVILVASPDAPSSHLVKAQLALAADYQRPILVVWARGEDWKTANPGHWREQDVIDVRGRSYESGKKILLIQLK